MNTCETLSKQTSLTMFRLNTCEKQGRGCRHPTARARSERSIVQLSSGHGLAVAEKVFLGDRPQVAAADRGGAFDPLASPLSARLQSLCGDFRITSGHGLSHAVSACLHPASAAEGQFFRLPQRLFRPKVRITARPTATRRSAQYGQAPTTAPRGKPQNTRSPRDHHRSKPGSRRRDRSAVSVLPRSPAAPPAPG